MLTVSQLLQFDPSSLGASAEQWRALAGGVGDHGEGLRADLRTWLDPANWDGPAATAARGQADGLTTRFTTEAERLQGIAGTLDTAATGLAGARTLLQNVVATAAANGLSVAENGTVTLARPVADPAEATRLRTVASYLTGAAVPTLAAATELDVATAAALRADVAQGSGSRGFTGGVEDDVARAVEIIRSGNYQEGNLSELDQLLRDNAGNPEFAMLLYSELGPDEVLFFVDGVGQWGPTGGGGPAMTGSVQAGLGDMLAMVTDPASPAYLGQSWTEDLLDTEYPELHYPALGVLLNSGTYSTEFLLATADAFTAYEDGDASVWNAGGAQQINWVGFPDTNVGLGADPMTGLMSAFGRNGEASAIFFDPVAHPERVEYYLHGREEVLPGFDQDDAFHDTLGQALESAVGGDPHDATSAHIMSETVRVLGDPDLHNGDVPETMRDSVGNMVAEYIGDVNAAFTYDQAPGYPPPDGETADFDADFPGMLYTPPADEAHALFDQDNLLRVMAGAAEDADAYASMYAAQSAYTGLVVGETATDTTLSEQARADQIAGETEKLAYVFGALDEGRASAVEDLHTDADAAHNANASVAEKIAGGVGGFLWDEVFDSTPPTKILKLGLDPVIDWIFGSQDSSEAMAREIADIYEGGSEQAAAISQMIMEQYGLWDDSEDLKIDNANGYDAGANDMARALGES